MSGETHIMRSSWWPYTLKEFHIALLEKNWLVTGLRWIVFELTLAMLRNFHLGNPRGMCDSILNEEKSIPPSCGLRAADDSEEHMWHHTLFWLCDLYTSPYPAWLVSKESNQICSISNIMSDLSTWSAWL